MKTLAFVLLISLSCNAIAQNSPFVRVYDLNGRKTHKGKIAGVTDSTLTLWSNNGPVTIPVRGIGAIRTRRSAGHNLLLGAIIGTVSGAIFGAASTNEVNRDSFLQFNAGAYAAGGAILGLGAGLLSGAISLAFKHSVRFSIDGDPAKWKEFRSAGLFVPVTAK